MAGATAKILLVFSKMGDETKENELRQGNYDPLHATRKPSSAEAIDERPAPVAEMPTADEVARRRRVRRRTRGRSGA